MQVHKQTTQEHLADLRLQIVEAERTLATLQAAILQARSDGGAEHLEHVLAENERLLAQADRDTVEIDSAHAALDAAIRAAETDTLTGLPNRLVLWDRLAHGIALARRHGSLLALYYLDLDGFKAVNDRFGHAAGDVLLQVVATRLIGALRASDTVCRLGGDEFVVVVPEADPADIQSVALKILDALRAPCRIDGHVLSPSASIGFSLYPADGEEPETLLRKADEAMYHAKKRRRPPART